MVEPRQNEDGGVVEAADLRSPYPWFGGKSQIMAKVWKRFGRVRNFVDPFCGSCAPLLTRPQPFEGTETVNDLNGWLCNFWRALQADPDAVAKYADWIVSELDLHARGDWLFYRPGVDEWIEQLRGDPDFYDAKSAGWWVWGQCAWIGGEWGRNAHNAKKNEDGEAIGVAYPMPHLGNAGRGVNRQLPHLGNAGLGVNRKLPHLHRGRGVNRKLPHLGDAGRGVNRKLPHLHRGRGVNRKLPHLGDAGRGVNRKLPHLSSSQGVNRKSAIPRGEAIRLYMQQLCVRLRNVRVCCGDWSRVCGPTPTFKLGLTAIFFDPPYAVADRDSVYGEEESRTVAHDVRQWCLENGGNKLLRIALCGYSGEHDALEAVDWSVLHWKTNGGYANQSNRGNENVKRERIWFSPWCLKPELERMLF